MEIEKYKTKEKNWKIEKIQLEKSIKNLKRDHKKCLKRVNEKYKNEIETIIKNHKKELARIRAKHSEEIEVVRSKHNSLREIYDNMCEYHNKYILIQGKDGNDSFSKVNFECFDLLTSIICKFQLAIVSTPDVVTRILEWGGLNIESFPSNQLLLLHLLPTACSVMNR